MLGRSLQDNYSSSCRVELASGCRTIAVLAKGLEL
jgi:hypothetical protein